MIHIVTVHWQDDSWIDIQLDYLHRHVGEPFKVYAFLNGVPAEHGDKFFYFSSEDIRLHEVKINLLADMVALHSTDDDDWLLFLDGDAFPISDFVEYGRSRLALHPLIAVQRVENAGSKWPHPSFCLTTVGFWRSIQGDWHRLRVDGQFVSDVGGVLHQKLEEAGISWLPMHRTNTVDLHPLWFGIYDDVVYHHGAGFRLPISAIDQKSPDVSWRLIELHQRFVASLPTGLGRFLGRRWNPLRSVVRNSERLSAEVFEWIKAEPVFFRRFQTDGEERG